MLSLRRRQAAEGSASDEPLLDDAPGCDIPAGEMAPLLPKQRQRNVNVMSLVAIFYFAVAGGPQLTETLIQFGGPLYSVIGFIVVGVLWSVPVALMSAELTTAFPENGGYVLWVSAAFGNQVANPPRTAPRCTVSRRTLCVSAHCPRSPSPRVPLPLSLPVRACVQLMWPAGRARCRRGKWRDGCSLFRPVSMPAFTRGFSWST